MLSREISLSSDFCIVCASEVSVSLYFSDAVLTGCFRRSQLVLQCFFDDTHLPDMWPLIFHPWVQLKARRMAWALGFPQWLIYSIMIIGCLHGTAFIRGSSERTRSQLLIVNTARKLLDFSFLLLFIPFLPVAYNYYSSLLSIPTHGRGS